MYLECRAGAQIIFSESGRGLGHVTPTIFGIRSNISPKLLELVTSNLVSSFDCRVLRRVYYVAVWSAILATAWLLVENIYFTRYCSDAVRCGGIFISCFITNFPTNLPVKIF